MATYTGIKKDTTFPITIGGNTLINLQKLLLYVLADKTDEEIQTAYQKILANQLEEEWYEHYAFLAGFIHHIETVAKEKNLTVEEQLDATPPTESGN
jgi:hypothetical protein